MKAMIQRFALLVIVFVTVFLVAGCASVSGPVTLKMTRDDADWGMVRFNNRASVGGLITPQEEERVKSAYKAYLTAFDQAVKQANGNLDVPTPDNVKQLADKLASALASVP